MALLVFNKTTSPVALAAGHPVRTIPASTTAGQRGPAVDVTSELWPNTSVDAVHGKVGGLSAANFTSLQAQVAATTLVFEWTTQPVYTTGALVITSGFTVSTETPTNVSGNASITVGGSTASGTSSLTVGGSTATGNASLTVGGSTASGTSSLTVGGSTDTGNASLTVGGSTASGTASITVGGSTDSGNAATGVTDTGHTHSVTVSAETLVGCVSYTVPLAAEAPGAVGSVVAPVLPANGPQAIIANTIDYPRKLLVEILVSGCTTGDITLAGRNANGSIVSETFALTAVTLFTTANAFATLATVTIANVTGAAGTVGVGLSAAFGLPTSNTPAGATVSVMKADVDNDDEAVGTVDATAGTIIPTTLPNATHSYQFWYTYSATPTAPATGSSVTSITVADSGHTHGSSALTATDAGHTHGATGLTSTDAGHTHGSSALTSTDAGHTHGATGLTSTDAGHTHGATGLTSTDAGHTHGSTGLTSTDAGHNHAQNSHTHTLS